ncbi:MAG: hypothetical protein V4717_10320 [Bacteroidota bacterium]
MEVKRTIIKLLLVLLWLTIFSIAGINLSGAQDAGKTDFKDGSFSVELYKHSSLTAIEEFISKYDLGELNLKQVLKTSQTDTLTKLGWKILVNNKEKLVITKPLFGTTNINDPVKSGIAQSELFAALFPVVSSDVAYGVNRFKNKSSFAIKSNSVTFYLRNKLDASEVMLAGSFNNWDPAVLPMRKTEAGWIADVKLKPGKYWYKFIIDGKWEIDHDNELQENDGLGNTNSVYYFSNHTFTLNNQPKAKNVYVSGSFNSWRQRELKMVRSNTEWLLPIYLAEGTHRYKYIVDGSWMTDPGNREVLSDGTGGLNSVVKFGKPTLFKLSNYSNATSVMLSGNFNEWRSDELPMKKTADGWELLYTLAPGNYEYKFVVDGNWITDPQNAVLTSKNKSLQNSFLVVGGNYTFGVKGIQNAREVYLAGDFNNWSDLTLPMKRVGDKWMCKVYLAPGKHKYKLIVDGQWITDPSNEAWEQNEFGTGNSIIWIDSNSGQKI